MNASWFTSGPLRAARWVDEPVRVALTASKPLQDAPTGAVAPPVELTGKRITEAGDELRFLADPVSWTGDFTARGALIYCDSGSLGFVDFEEGKAVSNDVLEIAWERSVVLKLVVV